MITGLVVADEKRTMLLPSELLALIAADEDGHGVTSAQAASGKAQYTFDIPNTPLRFIVLDTAATTGGADGLIRQTDIDSFIKPALDQALAADKWVILASHHATSSLHDGSGFGGEKVADAVLEGPWQEFVGGYPNVLFSLVGHSHEHRTKYITATTGHGWWEVMTSAIADYPHQVRVIEIWDQDNGWATLESTVVDFSAEGDPVTAEGRTFGIVDFVAGWIDDGRGEEAERNVELWIQTP